MLDDLSLGDRLNVALEWFRRSTTGEFEFASRHAANFEELLRGCQEEATSLEQKLNLRLADPATQPLVVRGFCDGRERDPRAIACRALRSDRDAMQLPLVEIVALAVTVKTLLGGPNG